MNRIVCKKQMVLTGIQTKLVAAEKQVPGGKVFSARESLTALKEKYTGGEQQCIIRQHCEIC